jgi:hypothetical protein
MKSDLGIWASVKAGKLTIDEAFKMLTKILRYKETKTYRRVMRLVK